LLASSTRTQRHPVEDDFNLLERARKVNATPSKDTLDNASSRDVQHGVGFEPCDSIIMAIAFEICSQDHCI
jgi:hypothetical protein